MEADKRLANRKSPAAFHKGHYKQRHHVENFFQRIKEKKGRSDSLQKTSIEISSVGFPCRHL